MNASRSVRIKLNVAQGRNTVMARSGSGVHHIAFFCSDMFATVPRLVAAGVSFLPIPDNYYLDLAARFGLTDEFVDRLRANGILYDRTDSGEYFHVFTESFEGRFSSKSPSG